MDRIADSGSADGGSNPSGHTSLVPTRRGQAFFMWYGLCNLYIILLKKQGDGKEKNIDRRR